MILVKKQTNTQGMFCLSCEAELSLLDLILSSSAVASQKAWTLVPLCPLSTAMNLPCPTQIMYPNSLHIGEEGLMQRWLQDFELFSWTCFCILWTSSILQCTSQAYPFSLILPISRCTSSCKLSSMKREDKSEILTLGSLTLPNLAVQWTLKSLLPTPQFKSISSSALSFLYSPNLTSICDYWKNHSFD